MADMTRKCPLCSQHMTTEDHNGNVYERCTACGWNQWDDLQPGDTVMIMGDKILDKQLVRVTRIEDGLVHVKLEWCLAYHVSQIKKVDESAKRKKTRHNRLIAGCCICALCRKHEGCPNAAPASDKDAPGYEGVCEDCRENRSHIRRASEKK